MSENADVMIPRAEEIIAEAYRLIREARDSGSKPDRIVIHRSLWDRVDEYRRSLGVVTGPVPDYLAEDSLFGIEIWYGDSPGIRVE